MLACAKTLCLPTVLNMINTCSTCANRGPSQQMEPPVVDADHVALLKPMQEIAVNFAGKNFLNLVDRCSSCVYCEETKFKTIVETVKVLRKWFEHFGYPKVVRADDGPAFRSGLNHWLEENNIVKETSAANNSQSNGLAERAVKSCKEVIKKCMDERKDWRTGLKEMRSQPSSVLDGASPAEVFHGGRKPRLQLSGPKFMRIRLLE